MARGLLLQGDQIELRKLEWSDLDLLVEWRNKAEYWQHFFNVFPLTKSGQDKWYESLSASKTTIFFMIYCRERNEPVGTIALDKIDSRNQSAEYGNLLIANPKRLGKGVAQEASRLLVDYAFHHVNLRRLYLYVFSNNERAIRLYKKIGFKKEGLLKQAVFSKGRFRDLTLMALLKSGYKTGS